MSDLDNRIRLDQMPVDFTESGSTSELHDTYPAANTEARYDLMRTYLIGLLSNQSCDEYDSGMNAVEPFEKRTGTLWYQKISKYLKIRTSSGWENLASHIGVSTQVPGTDAEESEIVTLQELLDTITASMKYVTPRIVWSGTFSYSGTHDSIPIPEKFQGYAAIRYIRPMVYINGLLLDPRITEIQAGSPAYIKIHDAYKPKPGQTFTAILEPVYELEQATIVA